MPQRRRVLLISALLALSAIPIFAAPVAATNVANEAEFRAAWGNPAEALITLTANITFACDGTDLPAIRNSATAIVVEGAGFTLAAPAPCYFFDAIAGDGTLIQSGAGAVTVRNLTFTGNAATNDGLLSAGDVTVEDSTFSAHGDDAVDTDGNATVTRSTFTANEADGLDLDTGTATVSDSTISNSADSGIDTNGNVSVAGSTISNSADTGIETNGNVSVAGSTISSNLGGGIVTTGNVSVTGSTINSNDEFGCVGGISAGGTVSVTNSTVSQNAEAGIQASGDITVSGSTVSNNVSGECNPGEGIIGSSAVDVSTSTVSGNERDGIRAGGTATVTATTVTGNGEDGIDADIATVTNSTITDNNQYGIFAFDSINATYLTVSGNGVNLSDSSGQTIHLFGSVVVDPGQANCISAAAVDNQGFNFVDDASCAPILPNLADPQLGALASNGGPTQTRLPAATSPLLNAIPDAQCRLTTDQRAITRPQGAGCDIGAVEVFVPLPAVSIADAPNVIEGGTGTTVEASFTVTLSKAWTRTVTVVYAAANGSATAPADYLAESGTVTFAPGDVSETITVTVVGDPLDEPNESFVVNLSAPTEATIADAQGTGTILDDDLGPVVTPTPAAAQLPDTGTGGEELGGWGTGVAIGLVVLSATVLILNRRRQVAQRR